ncbi:MAG: mechanosensitive ion channel family protein [Prosthecochloris sp.]|nr:mechanosensitive ion channel family protein [Prosthecochloris sp.]
MMDALLEYVQAPGLSEEQAKLVLTGMLALLATGLLVVSEMLTKRILLGVMTAFASKTRTRLDDLMVKNGVFRWVAHLVPPVLLYNLSVPVFQYVPEATGPVQSLATIYLTIILIIGSLALLDAVLEYYNTHPVARRLPLKSFVQVIKTVIVSLGSVVVVAELLGTSPLVFFSGIGAFTAIIILIFKDSILGFVAGIQLSTNNLVKVGDWIEMPKYGADGDVIDISLVTVSVQNWDKTISTIPAYALISEGFKNWRGMSESGGRRIMRSVNIDMQSVKFCDEQMLERLQSVQLLQGFLKQRQQEIEEFNRQHDIDASNPVNGRRMTNIGVFRAYLIAYLRRHPKINASMTFLVRHLQPGETGLPVQIYVFSNDVEWANYEAIQADIMDHILAVMPYFDLRVFQNPSGRDLAQAADALLALAAKEDETVMGKQVVPEASRGSDRPGN